MTRLLLTLAASLLLLMPGCAEEPPPEEPEPEPAEDTGGLLFASAAEDIVMKDAPDGSVFGAAEATPAPPPPKKAATSTAARAGGDSRGWGGGRTITADQVKAVVKAKTPQVRACYERELKKKEGLRGKVVLAWTVGADGRVSGARAVKNTTRNAAMIPCMTRAVSNWQFPRAEASFDVEYPFIFKPRDW